MAPLKNIRNVDRMMFGRGSLDALGGVLQPRRRDSYMVFLVDDYFDGKPLLGRLPAERDDQVIAVNVDDEPKTSVADGLCDSILEQGGKLPAGIVGIGGGSVMDYAKSVSVLLTNPGGATRYQGLNLTNNPSVYHLGVPTLSGTGAEVSTTAILTGPDKKLGIKGEHTPFNQIVLDPELPTTVPKEQWFYTGMDAFIHNTEVLSGRRANTLSNSLAHQSNALCREVFESGAPDDVASNEKLMVASWQGGLALSFAEVGLGHAFSYGLSYVLELHHGIANCIAFRQLREFYPDAVEELERLADRHDVPIPANVVSALDDEQVDKMIDTIFALEHMWLHAIGPDWRDQMTRGRAREILRRM